MRHALVSRRRPPRAATHGPALRLLVWPSVVVAAVIAAAVIADQIRLGRLILSAVQQFLLFYTGVFALLALTAVVFVGLVNTDRVLMPARWRVAGQSLHRALAFGAVAALAAHIALEIAAHRSHVVDAVVPFLAQDRTLYVGIGTIASDLIILIVMTSVARGRFAARWPHAWRPIHATSYVAWVLSILHGLLAGRQAKPYVDWSYGVCVALVLVALAIRLRAARRPGPSPVPVGQAAAGRVAAGRLAPRRVAMRRAVGRGSAQQAPVPARLPVTGGGHRR